MVGELRRHHTGSPNKRKKNQNQNRKKKEI
jgi:hypothetical protein